MTDKWKALGQSIEKDYGNTAGIVVMRDGAVLYEGYFHGNTAADSMHVYSVTKSVFSALIGIAIGQGFVRSVEQPVLDFFPDYTPDKGNETARLVTLRHMLTMTAPFRCEEEPYEAFFTSENWVRFALDLLGGEQPGRFRYSPIIGAHILAGALANATGQSVLGFAAENLFLPLGIQIPKPVALRGEAEFFSWYEKPRYEPSWAVDPQGVNPASWGLTLTPMEMARFGELYRNGGVWGGRQIVPASWVKESVAVHSRWEEMGARYGYLWWLPGDGDGISAAMGDGGNTIYVNANRNLVVAIACRFEEGARDRLSLIRGVIEEMI